MDFFTRRKACLFVEEQKSVELTKKKFSRKIEFLQRQYKFCFDALHKNEELSPDFVQGPLFLIDLGSKILSALHHLANSSEIEWAFLKSLMIKDKASYVFGTLKENIWILQADIMCKESDSFFFKLLNLGLLDTKTWLNLSRLRSARSLIGIAHINDFSYYESQGKNIIDPPEDMKKLDKELISIRADFYSFLGKRIEFKELKPIFWVFLKETKKLSNFKYVEYFFSTTKYQYELIRDKSVSIDIGDIQRKSLVEGLSKINNFKSFHNALGEFRLFPEPEIRKLFEHIFLFFLHQKGCIFDADNPSYSRINVYEKFMHATKFIDMFIYLCENNIDLKKALLVKEIEDKLKSACELELAILKEKGAVNHMYVLNFSNFVILADFIHHLRGNALYQSLYSKYLEPYFSIIGSF